MKKILQFLGSPANLRRRKTAKGPDGTSCANRLRENEALIEKVVARQGPIRGKRWVEFHISLPNKDLALTARGMLVKEFPPGEERQIYVEEIDGQSGCCFDERTNVDPVRITEIECAILRICGDLMKDKFVSWGFDSTPYKS